MPGLERAIVGFRQDDVGDWVAELECGHTQHVRHKPPWQERPWVLSEQGRVEHLGAKLSCQLCLMPRLPPGLVETRRTPEYDEASAPRGLLASHRLRSGSWGEIVVVAGHVTYVIEDEAKRAFVLRPGVPGVVEPERPHHVALQPGARFYVRFLRAEVQSA